MQCIKISFKIFNALSRELESNTSWLKAVFYCIQILQKTVHTFSFSFPKKYAPVFVAELGSAPYSIKTRMTSALPNIAARSRADFPLSSRLFNNDLRSKGISLCGSSKNSLILMGSPRQTNGINEAIFVWKLGCQRVQMTLPPGNPAFPGDSKNKIPRNPSCQPFQSAIMVRIEIISPDIYWILRNPQLLSNQVVFNTCFVTSE